MNVVACLQAGTCAIWTWQKTSCTHHNLQDQPIKYLSEDYSTKASNSLKCKCSWLVEQNSIREYPPCFTHTNAFVITFVLPSCVWKRGKENEKTYSGLPGKRLSLQIVKCQIWLEPIKSFAHHELLFCAFSGSPSWWSSTRLCINDIYHVYMYTAMYACMYECIYLHWPTKFK